MSLCLAFFIIMLDTTLIPFLYPLLISDLELGVSEVAAVNNLYLIAYAGTLLLGGRLGDIKDRKKIFSVGLLMVGAGSLLGALSGNYHLILIARFVMGVGAGLITPQSMAFISNMFEPDDRGLAFGIWGAVASIGTGLGPVLAKSVAAFGYWEIAFWVNIPVILLSLILSVVALETTYSDGLLTFRQMSFPIIAGLALMAFVYGIQVLSPGNGFTGLSVIMIVIAFILGAMVIKLRRSGLIAPIVDFSKTDQYPYKAAVFASALLGGSLTAYYLPLSLSFSYVWRFDEITIICLMVFASVVNAIFGVLAGVWSNKWGTRLLIISGLIIFSISCFLFGGLSFIGADEKAFLIIASIIILVLAELGTGIAFGPLANSSMLAVGDEIISEAAAFYNWVRQAFSAIGGVTVAFIVSSALGGRESSDAQSVGFASFVGFTFVGIALLIAAYISRGVKNG
ncbi:MFS transporter [Corynebacterium mustelae]|uniref:MFS transporter n=1 Tax=Corynebacterium mustelae TaxID=571915 RepID=UPI001EEE7341|nr:MFS transporter [Corynebacterium mustelae]